MFKPINGYTKKKILEVIAGMQPDRSMRAGGCVYRGDHGAKCAVGAFIPDLLYYKYDYIEGTPVFLLPPEISKVLPLEEYPMIVLQRIHDNYSGDVRIPLSKWVEENVEEDVCS
jgi:hypothetical protein